MGAWSSSLYGNDTTCDVRDTYMLFLKDQLSNDEAYQKTLEKFQEIIGSDEEPLLWFALAETQWKVGRLISEVKGKALDWIEGKGGLESWLEYGGNGKGWLKTLEKLQQKLESPMPLEKKIRKPEDLDMNPWALYDVYAYQFNKKISEENGVLGKYIIIQKIGQEDYWNGATMRIQIYDRIFDEKPTLEDLQGLRILPLDFPSRFCSLKDAVVNGTTKEKEPIWMNTIWMNTFMILYKKSEYPKKHLTFLGNTKGLPNTIEVKRVLSWFDIETWLYKFYMSWQGIEYDTVGDGEYDYLGNV